MYLIINEVYGYFEEINENKYLTLVSTDKNEEVLTKYTELWDGIKNSVEKISNKSGEYGKDFMKINNMTIIARSVFEEDGKDYPQVFFDECLHEL